MMPKRLKGFSTFLMSTAIVALVSGGALAQNTKKPGGGRLATLVQVDTVKVVPFAQTIPVIGRFIARQAGVVAARAKGAIGKINVGVGDRIKAGAVMAVLVRDRLLWERNL